MTDTLEEFTTDALWRERHLLGLEHLSAGEINTILDLADRFQELTNGGTKKLTVLNGRWVSQSRQLGHCHRRAWLEKPHSLH